MGDMMTDLDNLYRAVGGSTAAEISKQGDFIKKVVIRTDDILIIKCFFLIWYSGQHQQARRS